MKKIVRGRGKKVKPIEIKKDEIMPCLQEKLDEQGAFFYVRRNKAHYAGCDGKCKGKSDGVPTPN